MTPTDWISAISTLVAAGAAIYAVYLASQVKKMDLSEWKGAVDADRATFKEFMKEVRADIREINKNILKIFSRLATTPDFIDDQSPLGLTELGQEVSKELDAAMWAEKTAEKIKNDVEDKEAYNIQEFCFLYANDDKNYTDEELALILRYAYRKGVPKEKVQGVFGIELRDKLIEMMGLEAP